MDTYESIGLMIQQWCVDHFYDDFVVTILLDDEPLTTLYRFDVDNDSFIGKMIGMKDRKKLVCLDLAL